MSYKVFRRTIRHEHDWRRGLIHLFNGFLLLVTFGLVTSDLLEWYDQRGFDPPPH